MVESTGGRRLGRSDWARAALEAVREGGISEVKVETLAERLGTTKGSFYWHFKDRGELVQAALELWEQQMTVALLGELRDISDPRTRLEQLLDAFAADRTGGSMHAALLSAVDDARVGPVLRRIAERRQAFIREALVACGVPADRAHLHAVLASALYLGYWGLERVLPQDPAFTTGTAAFVEHVRRVLASELPPA